MLTKRLPEEDRIVQQIEDMCQEIDRLGKQDGCRARMEELLTELETLLQDFKLYREKNGLR